MTMVSINNTILAIWSARSIFDKKSSALVFCFYFDFLYMIATLIGLVLSVIFLLLSAIHVYWGLGGKWGVDISVPTKVNHEKVMNPTSMDCFVVAIGLLAFAFFTLTKIRFISFALPSFILNYGLLVISGLFTIRAIGDFKYVGFFKKIKHTPFGRLDTRYYSPLCLALAIMGVILELYRL